jgi:hypothetical protein
VGVTVMEVIPPVVPVPVKFTDCGLFGAPSLTEIEPFLVPTAVGVNCTIRVQKLRAASVPPQVPPVDTAKSPVVDGVMEFSAVVWLLASVAVLVAELVVTTQFPKLALVIVSVAGLAPVPVRLICCGLLLSLSLMESVAL